MFFENLLDKNVLDGISKNRLGAVFKNLVKSGKYNVVIVKLDEGSEIPPHPEPYAVTFIVIEGEGVFTTKDGEFSLKKDSMISMKKKGIRGIKALKTLTIIGIQDGH